MNPTTISFYVVRAEYDGMPESYLAGVYPTEKMAQARCDELESEGYDVVWYDEVLMGPEGADCMFSNR